MSKNLYHVSLKNLGKSKIFTPRIPTNRFEGDLAEHPWLGRIPEDDTIPRICVTTNISYAINAIGLPLVSKTGIRGYLYKALNPRAVSRDLPRILVPDANETNEHWILSKTKMQRIGTIRIFDTPEKTYWEWIKKDEE